MAAIYTSLETEHYAAGRSNLKERKKDEPVIEEVPILDEKDRKTLGQGSKTEKRTGAQRGIKKHRWMLLWSVLRHFFPLGCFIGSLTVLVLVSSNQAYDFSVNMLNYGFGICGPNGDFIADPSNDNNLNPWSTSNTFQVTMGFGQMHFTKAKFIDITWDIVVGRGGQTLLALITYRVFTKALSRLMERSSVSYGTFASVTLGKPSLSVLRNLAGSFSSVKGSRARLYMLWMVIASAYVIIFPTLMSAMTGYKATTTAWVLTDDGSNTPWSDFREVYYIIHDGSRVGLTDDYLVIDPGQPNTNDTGGPGNPDFANWCAMYYSYPSVDFAGSIYAYYTGYMDSCFFLWHVSDYAYTYGLNGANTTSSAFNDSKTVYNLTDRSLNISTFYIPDFALLAWDDNAQDISNVLFVYDNKSYDLAYLMNQTGSCQPVTNQYQWGFSFLLLFVALLLTTIWALGMWIMWLDTYLHSSIDQTKLNMGMYRAILDLSAALTLDVGADDASGRLSDRELQRRVGKDLQGGKITYTDLDNIDWPDSRWTELRSWLLERRWGRWIFRKRK